MVIGCGAVWAHAAGTPTVPDAADANTPAIAATTGTRRLTILAPLVTDPYST